MYVNGKPFQKCSVPKPKCKTKNTFSLNSYICFVKWLLK